MNKTYRLTQSRTGFFGSLQNIFHPRISLVQAVSNLSLEVEQGEIVGLLGPNGAGKSSIIKMLTGILTPDSGQINVAGLIPSTQRRELAMRLGVVFGQRSQLWWDLPLIDSLHLQRYIYQVPKGHFEENLKLLRTTLDLDDFINKPVRQLSLGQRMRGDLAAVLLHDPALLYLDEPTIGLDVVVKARIREFLLSINKEKGTTIILTTHDMRDVESLCSRLLIVDHGQKLYDGTIATILTRYGGKRILVAELEPSETQKYPEKNVCFTTHLPQGVSSFSKSGSRLLFEFDQHIIPAHKLVAWIGTHQQLRDVTFEEPKIEDVLCRIYEEKLLSTEKSSHEAIVKSLA